ncbi:MAG TPA: DUF2156 domain-containing protein, partial [Armatimonadota bacterium]|nr:DUF2156 domain-containing protein [Armatimonadota bacterium]
SVAHRFIETAAAAGKRACFFAVEGRLVSAASLGAYRVGEQPVWNPASWEQVLRTGRSLREQLRRARAKGVTVRPLAPEEVLPGSRVRRAVEGLIGRWLEAHSLAPMEFLVQVSPFEFGEERRLFVAEREGRIAGFLAMVPVYARGGWLLEDLLREPDAPNGTAELLVDHAMRAAAAEGSRYATLGLAPLAGVGGWLGTVRHWSRRLYDFEGLRAFKAKFRPDHWEPVYLAYPRGQNAVLALLDALSAFAPRGLVRFGLETALRSPALVLRVLALLLVPWTLLLAAVPTAEWFPGRWVQAGWVLFDAGLVAGLLSLARRWRAGLARLLALLITGDALLTLWEAVAYNVPRNRTPLQWAVTAVALAAPAAAALFLWSALRVGRQPRAEE